ncbi:blue light receptor [Quaeritorhiza haematococci]|nr:blue light receptor [Quaeritorhiza haematococci]
MSTLTSFSVQPLLKSSHWVDSPHAFQARSRSRKNEARAPYPLPVRERGDILDEDDITSPLKQYLIAQRMASLPPMFGMYSNSGFDMISILARVACRPNPVIDLGPVDFSSSFIVVDARKFDFPIVYASETFERLTGYSACEIVGSNCRFLQSPDGRVERGQPRKYVDNQVVYQLKQSVDLRQECQYINVNYKKGGEPFVNLITIIPIMGDSPNEIAFFVGFQVDLMQQSRAILRRLEDGSYVIDLTKPSSQMPDASQIIDCQQFENLTAGETSVDLNSLSFMPSPPSDCISDDSGSGTDIFSSPQPISPRSMSPTPPLSECSPPPATASPEELFPTEIPQMCLDDGAVAEPETPVEEIEFEKPVPVVKSSLSPRLESVSSSDESGAAVQLDDADLEMLSHYNLIHDSPDFIHILSSRGIILYASPNSSKELLDYEAGELIGRNVSKFVHPGDFISLMRELKCCGVRESVSAVYRFRRKSRGYVWFEVTGHKYEMQNRKRTKCFILSGREIPVGTLKQQGLAKAMISSSTRTSSSTDLSAGLWMKVSSEGFILFVNPTSAPVLGVPLQQMYGRSIADFFTDADKAMIKNGVHQALFPESTDGIQLTCTPNTDSTPRAVTLYPQSSDGRVLFVHVDSKSVPSIKTESSATSSASAPSTLEYLEDMDVFGSVGVKQSTSLQYELNQIKMANKRLKEELDALMDLSSKRFPLEQGNSDIKAH